MTGENKSETPATAPKKARKPAKPKKAPKTKKESTPTPALTEAQRDRFIASFAKQKEMTDKQARDHILARGVQRMATLARWQDKQS